MSAVCRDGIAPHDSGRAAQLSPSADPGTPHHASNSPDATSSDGHEFIVNLEAYIPGDRRNALARGERMPDRVHGAALFADISGFTPLTEALANELGPQRGAEELTIHLNRVFHALIAQLDRFGGHVIYFSGDAITCWLDLDDGARATACGLAMQTTMNELHEIVTPKGTHVRLAMKVAVAVGAARRFVVGERNIQLIDVLAGRLIDALAMAEHHAKQGEVVLEQSALDALGSRVKIAERRIDHATGRGCGIVKSLIESVADNRAPALDRDLSEDVAKQWLLPAVYERLRTGSRDFLAELRPAFPLFACFGGIDYDNDDDAPAKLDAFVREAQRILTSYGGNLIHLSVGDKGAYLYAVFGSPHAHEDDAARAAAAALELREVSSKTAISKLQIGVTHGRLRSGMYGHELRQAFTCLGDAVNLAARLMSKAPAGEIYVSAPVRRAAGDVFAWKELQPVHVKGKTEPVAIFALTGSVRHASRRQAAFTLPMVGRSAELERLEAKLAGALAGYGAVVGISAEAGMGKSRLISEFTAAVDARAWVAAGECQAFGTNTSYFVWREIWAKLFDLDDAMPQQEQVHKLEAALAAIDPAFVARAPLLAGLLDLPLPDNELTAAFDAKLRKASLETLLADCLRARASETPVVVVLEDCHWLDPLSRDLLEVLAHTVSGIRALLVVAYRPSTEIGGGLGIQKFTHFEEIALAELAPEYAAALIRSKLGQMFGTETEPPDVLIERITARAQGNPFYIEELLNYIRSKGVDPQNDAAVKRLELPDSLHSLILSRIDTLGEAPRRTLKVASVLGRTFSAPMLPGVYPELGALDSIKRDLATLGAADLVSPDVEANQTYLFKHAVTQEVAYESMPFAFRSMLHERVGGYIETSEPDAIDRNLDLLAHHYWHSANVPKKREYLGRAGAAAQAAYANAAAIDYFERLVPLLEGTERIDVQLKLGQVLELVGEWRRAEGVISEALALAAANQDASWRASCEAALAGVARKQGRFDEALERLDRAARSFESVGDQTGLGKVHHLQGNVALQRGEYTKATDSFETSLAIRERLSDRANVGSLLSNLGIIAEYKGDYEQSRQFHERAMSLRTAAGDRWGIGVSMQNLGQIAVLQKRFDEARDWFERTMQVSREVGDSWMRAICQHNLGNATRGLGDYAATRKHYAGCVRAYRDHNDRFNLAFALEDIALLAIATGDAPLGFELVGAADALRVELGMPRAPALDEELNEHFTRAASGMSERQRNALHVRGRSLNLQEAIEYALALCENAPRTAARRAARSVESTTEAPSGALGARKLT